MKILRRTITGAATGLLLALPGVALAGTTLRVASEEAFATPAKVAAQSALEHVEKTLPDATGGAVSVQLYPGGALGSEKELIKALADGTVDAMVLSPGNAAGIVPEVQLFSASYLFESYDHARAVIKDDAFFEALAQIIAEKQAGFQLAGIGLTGTRNYYSRSRAVETIEDLSGVKMRVMSSPTEFKVWSELGTLPTTIPAPEIYTSLQTGVVDAAESSLPAISGSKYYEVAPYISLTQHQFNLHLFLVSDIAMSRLSEGQQAAVLQAFREAGHIEIDEAIRLSDEVLAFLRERPGVTVTEVDTAPFAQKLRAVQDEVATGLGVEPLLEIIRSHGTQG
ncbi:TRAP transporter substrate-binding protein [Cereibacter azotoformans]|uniref:Tripartite ATP-independent transporter DctP family solute receptor n=1 Tax=Cereibacter azotoformans TaxID=43057 RepID=A0A2T5KD95_9RHOB|nr:TRAP transporter substrate-binding protein [Cereibacter azotoformans]AXQ93569.1 TRAP transporter substrate-binding protein [Cereibacter sphaeroides]MBO4168663.1 TRAP transporter substrate-binding protein [Cereibacter azotoformans]PTR20347.1 tripartite ATP-independent transporter DctP family solute receptor [Cereibacter azotoformans]UIJ31907.1 TRAP transporter substrate-binding protein [Cereibacter azotoformans]